MPPTQVAASDYSPAAPTFAQAAVRFAVSFAALRLGNLRWLKVVQPRGQVNNSEVKDYQVALKAGFTPEAVSS